MFAVGWDQKQIGPVFTLTSASRTLVLVVLLPGGCLRKCSLIPAITTMIKPRWAGILAMPSPSHRHESAPLLAEDSPNGGSERKVMSFDHALLLASMLVKCGGELILGMNARASGAVYIAGSLVLTLSAAASPCAGVLAVDFVSAEQRGELFGALGVVEAVSTTIVGPVLYTYIFVFTIDWYPEFMFLIAAVTGLMGAILVALIRTK